MNAEGSSPASKIVSTQHPSGHLEFQQLVTETLWAELAVHQVDDSWVLWTTHAHAAVERVATCLTHELSGRPIAEVALARLLWWRYRSC